MKRLLAWSLLCGGVVAFASAAPAQSSASSASESQSQTQSSPVLKQRSQDAWEADKITSQDPLAFLKEDMAILPPPVDLELQSGTPLRVAIKKALPIKHAGEAIRAYVTEPVYAFDRVVIPKGTEVDGRVTKLDPPSKLRRLRAYLNADFSPHRTVHVNFDTLVLKDGTRMPLNCSLLQNVGPVLRLEANPQGKKSRARMAKGLIRRQWDMLKAQLKPSALWHHAKSFVSGEWPYHKQKLAGGTVFEVELEEPLDFGVGVVSPAEMGKMGQLPAINDEAYARLATPLSSATAHMGTPVEAVLTRPVFSSDKKLLLPVGTDLEGIVVRARPARRLHRNGQLHFTLQRVQLPSGTPQPVEMALEGIEVAKSSNIQLDSEGGTNVAGNKEARVLKTALSIAIANSTLDQDREHGQIDPNGDPGNRGIAGGSGYKLLGFALGIGIQSRVFAQVMGFWGAGQSVYAHFLARGSDLVLPKDTPLEVSFGEHRKPAGS